MGSIKLGHYPNSFVQTSSVLAALKSLEVNLNWLIKDGKVKFTFTNSDFH